jgi:hypothetical protein
MRQTSVPPASGRVQWLADDPVTGNGWLRITSSTKAGDITQDYEVEQVQPGLYRLWRLDPRTYEMSCYNVRLGAKAAGTTCDCPDTKHRRGMGACKHALGLFAAVNSLPF